MAKKVCPICGGKLGIYRLRFKDGAICQKCLIKYKFGNIIGVRPSVVNWASSHTIADIQQMVNDGRDFSQMNPVSGTPSEEYQQKMDVIHSQMDEAGVSDLFGTKKEIKELPNILDLEHGEKIIYLASGMDSDGNTVLIVCTNTRVITIDKGLLYGVKTNVIPLDMVNGVTYSNGLELGKIAITNGALVIGYSNIYNDAVKKLAEAIKNQAYIFKNKSIEKDKPSNDFADQIRSLKSLLDDGIITQEEFDAKKKQILGI